MPKVDNSGECIKVDPVSGMVRVDGIIVCRVVVIPGDGVRLQFFDGNRQRSARRGANLVEVPISTFAERVSNGAS